MTPGMSAWGLSLLAVMALTACDRAATSSDHPPRGSAATMGSAPANGSGLGGSSGLGLTGSFPPASAPAGTR